MTEKLKYILVHSNSDYFPTLIRHDNKITVCENKETYKGEQKLNVYFLRQVNIKLKDYFFGGNGILEREMFRDYHTRCPIILGEGCRRVEASTNADIADSVAYIGLKNLVDFAYYVSQKDRENTFNLDWSTTKFIN